LHSISFQRIAAAVLASTALLLLPGCAGGSEAEQIASAKSYLEKKDPKSATIQLKTVLQKYPQSGEARFLLGQALFNGGEVGAAVLEFEKAHALKYSDDLLLPWLARAMTVAGQARKVTDQFGEVKLGSPVAAAELQTALAYAYGAQGMRDRSQAAVDAALQLDPKNVTAQVQKARLAGLRGAIDEALALVDAVLATDPQRLDAWQLKGEMLLGGKRDAEGATKAFNAALAAEPRFLPAHLALISLRLQNKDIAGFRTQVADLKKALPSSGETRFYEAHLAMLDGDLKSARPGAQQLLRSAPESARVLQLAGTIELRSGALLLAESHLGKAVQLAPELPAARLLLAQTYLRSGQTGT